MYFWIPEIETGLGERFLKKSHQIRCILVQFNLGTFALSPVKIWILHFYSCKRKIYCEISKAYAKMMPSMVKFSARLKIRIEESQNLELEPELFPGRRQIRITLTRGWFPPLWSWRRLSSLEAALQEQPQWESGRWQWEAFSCFWTKQRPVSSPASKMTVRFTSNLGA